MKDLILHAGSRICVAMALLVNTVMNIQFALQERNFFAS